ncbi:uncharacterized protein VICG_01609, partial [Vittaforma corneae ATCC 50505]
TELVFRKLRCEDIVHIHVLEQRYFADSFKLAHSFTNFIYDSRFSFVCERKGRIVGAIRAEKWKSKAAIDALCVEQMFSNRGIGRRLLEQCIESIKEHERSVNITLMVSENNKIAKRLYEDVGFEVQKFEHGAYFDGSGGFVMVWKGWPAKNSTANFR